MRMDDAIMHTAPVNTGKQWTVHVPVTVGPYNDEYCRGPNDDQQADQLDIGQVRSINGMAVRADNSDLDIISTP